MGSDSEEDSDLSFHINSTYCSSSDSEEDGLPPISRSKNLRTDPISTNPLRSANPVRFFLGEQQNNEFVDNPSGISHEGNDSTGRGEGANLRVIPQGKLFTKQRQPSDNESASSMLDPVLNVTSTVSIMEEVGQLKTEVTSLTQRNSALQAENRKLQQVEVNFLSQSRIKELTKSEESSRRRMCELLKVECEYQARIRELEQEIVDTQEFYIKELDDCKMKISEFEDSDTQMRQILANFETEKNLISQGENEMKGRINQLLAMLREAEDTAMREAVYHERVVSDLEKKLEFANNRVASLESLNAEQTGVIEAIESKCRMLEDQVGDLRTTIDQEKNISEELRRQILDLQSSVASLEQNSKEREKLFADISDRAEDSIKNSSLGLHKQIGRLTTELATCQSELEIARRGGNWQETLEKKQELLTQALREIDGLKLQILSLNDDLRRKENSDSIDLVRLRKVIEEREAQIQNLQGVREALEEANMRLREDLKTTQLHLRSTRVGFGDMGSSRDGRLDPEKTPRSSDGGHAVSSERLFPQTELSAMSGNTFPAMSGNTFRGNVDWNAVDERSSGVPSSHFRSEKERPSSLCPSHDSKDERIPSKAELANARAAELRAAIAANSLQENCKRRMSSGHNILEISIPKRAGSQDEGDSRFASTISASGSKAAIAELRTKELTEAIRGQQAERDARRSMSQPQQLRRPFADAIPNDFQHSAPFREQCSDALHRNTNCHSGGSESEPAGLAHLDPWGQSTNTTRLKAEGCPVDRFDSRSEAQTNLNRPAFGQMCSVGTAESDNLRMKTGETESKEYNHGDATALPSYRLSQTELSTRSLQRKLVALNQERQMMESELTRAMSKGPSKTAEERRHKQELERGLENISTEIVSLRREVRRLEGECLNPKPVVGYSVLER